MEQLDRTDLHLLEVAVQAQVSFSCRQCRIAFTREPAELSQIDHIFAQELLVVVFEHQEQAGGLLQVSLLVPHHFQFHSVDVRFREVEPVHAVHRLSLSPLDGGTCFCILIEQIVRLSFHNFSLVGASCGVHSFYVNPAVRARLEVFHAVYQAHGVRNDLVQL